MAHVARSIAQIIELHQDRIESNYIRRPTSSIQIMFVSVHFFLIQHASKIKYIRSIFDCEYLNWSLICTFYLINSRKWMQISWFFFLPENISIKSSTISTKYQYDYQFPYLRLLLLFDGRTANWNCSETKSLYVCHVKIQMIYFQKKRENC